MATRKHTINPQSCNSSDGITTNMVNAVNVNEKPVRSTFIHQPEPNNRKVICQC